MIKQGIYQMYSAAYWNLQIICSSKFSEDDDAIDIERQATNMFIWRMSILGALILFQKANNPVILHPCWPLFHLIAGPA